MTQSDKKYNPNDPYNRHGRRHETNDNSGAGKAFGIALGALAIATIGAAGLYLVDVDQTKEARLPAFDVKVTEGQMPAFDVEVADVSVGTKQVDVKIPTVDVETETKTIEVEVPVDVDAGTTTETIDAPTLSIERPEIDDPADNDLDRPSN
jgi:hypothetical protein